MRLSDVPEAWTVAPEPPAPPLRDLFRNGAARQAALKYHVESRALGLLQTGLHHALRPLPVPWLSAFGAALAPIPERANSHRPYVAAMARTLARLRPDLAEDAAAQARVLQAWWRNTARAYIEFSAIPKRLHPPHFELRGQEHLDEAVARGRPVVFTSVHLGGWEALGAWLRVAGPLPGFALYQPQSDRYQNRLITSVRRRYDGVALPAAPETPRRTMRLIAGGASLVLFIDEVISGRSRFPLFGRELTPRSNVIAAAKLSHHFAMTVVPCAMEHTDGARLILTFHPPIMPPDKQPEPAWSSDLIAQLDALYDPLIRARPEQWYMLAEARLAEP
ncbi:MAG: lysophospholipid acyltransferase family protein [Pseudomonadota bacterium]